ncbi:MAG: ubiquinone/menaquinone biosynthesis methyltransferase, partial [Muribaculaceae bacterium]|nr:ubiquinone/menaquinone biosynthesis methyltransferase [Muribaculaceae bacterium]
DGIDLSDGMLEVARRKAAQRDLQQHITFVQGDCLALPYPDESMDAVTVAFGVRNFEHIDQGYREMYRVLKPGGTLCVVELSTPTNRVVRWFYDLYTLHIIPFVGSLKSGDRDAYRYLPLSIAAVPQGEDMLELMRQAGFGHGAVQRLTFGTCSIYTAQR